MLCIFEIFRNFLLKGFSFGYRLRNLLDIVLKNKNKNVYYIFFKNLFVSVC